MQDTTRELEDRRELNRYLEFSESAKCALADAGLEFIEDYSTVAEGIRVLTRHRDMLVNELRRIKGIADGALGK